MLTDRVPFSSRLFMEDHRALPLSTPLSPPGSQWCGVPGIVPAGLSQAPQHFRSSRHEPLVSDGCFAHGSVSTVISVYSGMFLTVHPQDFFSVLSFFFFFLFSLLFFFLKIILFCLCQILTQATPGKAFDSTVHFLKQPAH